MRDLAVALAALAVAVPARDVGDGSLALKLRSRVEAFKGSGAWQEVHFQEKVPAASARPGD
jgi:hypothetical protein